MRRVFCFLLLLGGVAVAQRATGTISGTVSDPQHQAVPGAAVTLTNTSLNFVRRVSTDAEGKFTATELAAGPYRVEAKTAGLQLARPMAVTVGVGGSVQVQLVLGLREQGQSVTVRGRAREVEGQTAAPAVDRDSPKVANVVAGTNVTYLPSQDRDFNEFGALAAGTALTPSGVSVDGQPVEATAVAVDGANFSDPLEGGVRGGRDGGFFLPQSAVQELSMVHAGADAEVGGTNGGFVDVATKQGGNRIHGEQFYIVRPRQWSGHDAFGRGVDNTENVFGGALGGWVVKNKFYYFGSVEQDRTHVPYYTAFQPQAAGTAVPASLGGLEGETVGHNNPTALALRLDWVVGTNSTLNVMGTYNRVRYSDVNPGSTQVWTAEENGESLSGQSDWLHAELTTALGRVVNQAAAQWAGDRRDLMPNSTAAEAAINGFGVLGGNALAPHRYISDQRGASDDVAIAWHGQQIHVGGGFAHDPGQELWQPNLNGRLDYVSLAAYEAANPRRSQTTAGTVPGSLLYAQAQQRGDFYVNDRAPLDEKLTLTAGLRWDGQWNPAGVASDLAQWQPRLGLAWNPGKATIVRVSSGLFDAPTPGTLFQRSFVDNGANAVATDSLYGAGVNGLVATVAPGFRNPRSLQSAASVQQALGPKVDVTTGYTHNSTWDLPRVVDTNLGAATAGPGGMPVFAGARPVAAVGQALDTQSSAHSSYDAWMTTAVVQLPYSATMTSNYTLARTRDDGALLGGLAEPTALDPFDLALERGYANQDVRHSFNLSGTDRLPLGFKVNPAFVARSGMPYTPIVGFDTQNDGNDRNDRALLNGAVAGRNSLRQPAMYSLDVRFVKDITLKGRGHHLDLFLDVFNLTNHGNKNFGPAGLGYYGNAASPVFAAGQPLFDASTMEMGGPRAVQFTARLVWF